MEYRPGLLGLAILLVLVALALARSYALPSLGDALQPSPTPGNAGIANPAAVYCVEQGYRLETRTAEDGSQYGVCVFSDGSECGDWAFYRGECGKTWREPPEQR